MQHKLIMAVALAIGLAAPAAWGAQPEAGAAAPLRVAAADGAGKPSVADARAYFTDLELVNQDGKKVRFFSDALEGKTVLINVIYTNCKDACPLITQRLKEVRTSIGPMFGKEIYFVSISSDPVRDTPKALKAFAVKQQVDEPGWTFLTGKKENVDYILKKLGQFNENVEEHSTLLIAGNVPEKRWNKIRPDAPPQSIADRLRVLATGDIVPMPAGAAR